MNLNNEPFVKIKSKQKRVEMRLNDERRKYIKKNDLIVFKNNKTNELMAVKVKNLYVAKSFKEIYDKYDKILLGYNHDETASYIDMFQYYTEEQIEQNNALAIEIKYLKLKSYIVNKRRKHENN